MLKFIHNDFELDLTHLNVTFNWKNNWFQTSKESEYTFPFTIPEQQWSKIANLGSYNSVVSSNLYPGKLYNDGELVEATLKFQEKRGKTVSAIIFVGLENISSLETKLSGLNLMKFNVADLKLHAESILPQNYPAVNYNFPSIHTDKYDPTSNEFNDFKCINYYNGGAYVVNEIDVDTGVDQIRTILQPLPYLMYVLKRGFEIADHTLQGDILTIQDLQTALIFRDGSYFDSPKKDKLPFHFTYSQYDTIVDPSNNFSDVSYLKTLTVTKKGLYTLAGNIYVMRNRVMSLFGLFRNNILVSINVIRSGVTTNIFYVFYPQSTGIETAIVPQLGTFPIDINYNFEVGDIIQLQVTEGRRDVTSNPTPNHPEMSTLDLYPVRYQNPDGSPIISLLNLNEVDLNRVVPDMTFSQLIDSVRMSKNLSFDVKDKIVTMNFIKLDRTIATNAEKYDIEEPLETYNDERSFELFYADGKTNENHLYDSNFIDKTGVKLNTYTTNKNTIQIQLDLLPYPLLMRHSVNTAFAFDDETSKLRLVFYEAPLAATTLDALCFENHNFKIPNILTLYYADWINFRLYATNFQWNFVVTTEQLKEILKTSITYAYNTYHVLSEVEKERIDHMYYSVVAKSESLN